MVVQVDSASEQDIGGPNARPGIASRECTCATDVEPVPAALIAMRDKRRAFLKAGLDGFPVEGSHERQQ
jgi:hypothetical protein